MTQKPLWLFAVVCCRIQQLAVSVMLLNHLICGQEWCEGKQMSFYYNNSLCICILGSLVFFNGRMQTTSQLSLTQAQNIQVSWLSDIFFAVIIQYLLDQNTSNMMPHNRGVLLLLYSSSVGFDNILLLNLNIPWSQVGTWNPSHSLTHLQIRRWLWSCHLSLKQNLIACFIFTCMFTHMSPCFGAQDFA